MIRSGRIVRLLLAAAVLMITPAVCSAADVRVMISAGFHQAYTELAPAFERAVESGKPAVLELRIDPEAITTRTTLSSIRAHALRSGG